MKTFFVLSLVVSAFALQTSLNAQSLQERFRARAASPAPVAAPAELSEGEIEKKLLEKIAPAAQNEVRFGIAVFRENFSKDEVRAFLSKALDNPQVQAYLKEFSQAAAEKIKKNKDLIQYARNLITQAQSK